MIKLLRVIGVLVSILSIILIPCANLMSAVDSGDTFYALNLYSFLERGSECTTLPLFMSAIIGHWLLKLADAFNINDIMMLRSSAVSLFWLLSALVYFLFGRRLGKLTTLAGLAVAACFYKSCLTIVYYTQLSQIALVLLTICLLYAREKNNAFLYFCAGFIAVFSVSIRITNIAFFSMLIILLIGEKSNPVQWKKFFKSFFLGGGLAVACVAVIVHCTLGWPLLFKMPEAISSTSVDGHTPLLLPLYIIFGLIGPRGISLCLVWGLAFVLVYAALWFYRKKGHYRFLGIFILCSCVSFVLWQCGFFHLLLKDNFEYYTLRILGLYVNVCEAFFMCHKAIAFMVWANLFLIIIAIKDKMDVNVLRLLVSSFMVGIVGPFGSNTQLMPVIYAAFFIVPVVFYGIRNWVYPSLMHCRYDDGMPTRITYSLKASLCVVISVICLCSPLYVMTCSFSLPKIPIRYFFNKRDFLYEVKDCPKLAGFLFFEQQYRYFQACVKECIPHIPEGVPLIDLSGRCANYILNAPPVLKWRAGDTRYTTADSMRKQLMAMDRMPYILSWRLRKDIDDKLEVVESFVENKPYCKIVTPHFIIWKPST